eukprot:scaffold819_cov350-Prasinococcus_capsulatus_cf.AAC.6
MAQFEQEAAQVFAALTTAEVVPADSDAGAEANEELSPLEARAKELEAEKALLQHALSEYERTVAALQDKLSEKVIGTKHEDLKKQAEQEQLREQYQKMVVSFQELSGRYTQVKASYAAAHGNELKWQALVKVRCLPLLSARAVPRAWMLVTRMTAFGSCGGEQEIQEREKVFTREREEARETAARSDFASQQAEEANRLLQARVQELEQQLGDAASKYQQLEAEKNQIHQQKVRPPAGRFASVGCCECCALVVWQPLTPDHGGEERGGGAGEVSGDSGAGAAGGRAAAWA